MRRVNGSFLTISYLEQHPVLGLKKKNKKTPDCCPCFRIDIIHSSSLCDMYVCHVPYCVRVNFFGVFPFIP